MVKNTFEGYEAPLAESLGIDLNKCLLVGSTVDSPENYVDGTNVDELFQ